MGTCAVSNARRWEKIIKWEQSFGEYFDAQRDRLRKMLDNKDAQQNTEWMEDYKKRQVKKINERKS